MEDFLHPELLFALTDTYCGRNTHRSLKKRREAGERLAMAAIKRAEQELLIPLVIASGIDFSSRGWVAKVAKIIGKELQYTRVWMQEFMPELHAQCLLRLRSKRSGQSIEIMDARP